MATKLNMTLLLRRDDFTAEAKKDYVLQAGEPGYCIATKTFKVGDGATTWENLGYANKDLIESIIGAAIALHAAGYYTKEEVDELLAAEKKAREDAEATFKTKQTEYSKTGSTRETITSVTQDTNGEIEVTYGNIDFPTAEELGAVLSVTGKEAIKVTEGQNPEVSLAINNTGSNVVLSQTDDGLSANIDLSAYKTDAENEEKYKQRQTAVEAAETQANTFIDTIAQNENGEITITTKAVDFSPVIGANTDAATADTIKGIRKAFTEADAALDERLDRVEAFFAGAAEDETVEGELINALDTLKEIQEFATGEGTAAQEMLKAIDDNAKAIDALANETDGRVTVAEGKIADLEDEFAAEGRVTAAEEAIAKETEDRQDADEALDGRITALEEALEADPAHTHTNKAELDKIATDDVAKWNTAASDVASVLDGTKAAAKATTATSLDSRPTFGADVQAFTITVGGQTSEPFAPPYAVTAGTATNLDAKPVFEDAVTQIKVTVGGQTSEAFTVPYATNAGTAGGLSSAPVIDYNTMGDGFKITVGGQTSEGFVVPYAEKATADADGNVITETYATKAEVGVTKVIEGTDIKVTPATGTGEVTIAHKDYSSGTLTKEPTSLEEGDTYVFTGLELSNGHVTGGAMKSLADILSSMTFIFDGGTATTNI